jgi:uncharacterized membrane protein YfcA
MTHFDLFLLSLHSIDALTVYILVAFVTFIFWFMYEIVGSGYMALISAPLLFLGGLLSQYLFKVMMTTPVGEKDSNTVVTTSVGVLITLATVIIVFWAWSRFLDWKVKRKRIKPIAPRPVNPNPHHTPLG